MEISLPLLSVAVCIMFFEFVVAVLVFVFEPFLSIAAVDPEIVALVASTLGLAARVLLWHATGNFRLLLLTAVSVLLSGFYIATITATGVPQRRREMFGICFFANCTAPCLSMVDVIHEHGQPDSVSDSSGRTLELLTRRVFTGEALESDCAICLEPLRASARLRELTCGHAFHDECIVEWVRRAARPGCPLRCRCPEPLDERKVGTGETPERRYELSV